MTDPVIPLDDVETTPVEAAPGAPVAGTLVPAPAVSSTTPAAPATAAPVVSSPAPATPTSAPVTPAAPAAAPAELALPGTDEDWLGAAEFDAVRARLLIDKLRGEERRAKKLTRTVAEANTELEALRAKVRQFEESQMTELEKAQRRAAEAEATATALREARSTHQSMADRYAELLEARNARDTQGWPPEVLGLIPADADALVRAEWVERLRPMAEKLLVPPLAAAPATPPPAPVPVTPAAPPAPGNAPAPRPAPVTTGPQTTVPLVIPVERLL